MAIEVEQHIQREMLKRNLILVGWYHSHPRIAAQPTLRDCDAQLEYQIKMRGISDATYTPCIGLICAPYCSENPSLESSITAYWVVPPSENRPMEYGRPMLMQFTVTQDAEMTKDIKSEMLLAIDYYRQFDNELVKFDTKYGEGSTHIEKLKTTLYSKFPREQDDFQFWNWLRENFGLNPENEFIPPKFTKKEEIEIQSSLIPNVTGIEEKIDNRNEMETIETIVIDDKESTPKPEVEIIPSKNCSSEKDILIEDSDRDSSKDGNKDDKLLIRSLQEQLSLPSGLNMTPSPISSSLSLLKNSSTTINLAPSSTSPRDSPITIPSNSASPAKFEVPVRASPSPAKSDTSSTRNRNSPLPTNLTKYPSGLSISAVPVSESSVRGGTPNSTTSSSSAPQSKSDNETSAKSSTQAMQELLASSFSGGKLPNYADYTALFQQSLSKESNSSSSDKTFVTNASLAAATGYDPSQSSNMKDILSQIEKSSDLNYLLQSQYPYHNLPGLPQLSISANPPASSSTKSNKLGKRSSRSSSNSSQHQRTLEEDYKSDSSKINEFLRSQEYAKMLMEQADALNAAVAQQSYGELIFYILSFQSFRYQLDNIIDICVFFQPLLKPPIGNLVNRLQHHPLQCHNNHSMTLINYFKAILPHL